MSVIVLIICVAFWVMYLKKNPTEKSTTGPGGPSMPNATASSGINQMTKSTSQPQFKTFSSEDRTENI